MFLETVAGFWFLGKDIAKYSNSWRFCEDHHDSWGSTLEAVTCLLDQKWTHLSGKPGAWPYMDFLMTGGKGCKPWSSGAHCPGQTDDEYKSEFAIWSIRQSPLIVDTDLTQMTPIMKKSLLNEELIALHQNTDSAPGHLLNTMSCLDVFKCQIWGRKLSDDKWLVAMVNMTNKKRKVKLNFRDLGLKHDHKLVRDLWELKDLGKFKDSHEIELPAHGSHIITVEHKKSEDAPALIQ